MRFVAHMFWENQNFSLTRSTIPRTIDLIMWFATMNNPKFNIILYIIKKRGFATDRNFNIIDAGK